MKYLKIYYYVKCTIVNYSDIRKFEIHYYVGTATCNVIKIVTNRKYSSKLLQKCVIYLHLSNSQY